MKTVSVQPSAVIPVQFLIVSMDLQAEAARSTKGDTGTLCWVVFSAIAGLTDIMWAC